MGEHGGKVGGNTLIGWESEVGRDTVPTPGKQTLVQRALAATPAIEPTPPVQRADQAQAMAQLPHYSSIRRMFDRKIQAKADAGHGTAEVHAAAAEGISGAAGPLPHLEQIQRSFGRHEIGHVQAHIGGPATAGAQAMGAEAFATGESAEALLDRHAGGAMGTSVAERGVQRKCVASVGT